MAEKIEMPEPVKVYFKNLEFDPDNPNQMSTEQETGLDAMFERFGFLEPIIVQPLVGKHKQKIHHGEHRVKRLMKAGNTWAWGYPKELTDEDHRMLRQGMNKLRGTHDPEKDAAEYKILQEKGLLEVLAVLIAQPVEQLLVEKELVVVDKDAPMLQHHEETFTQGNLKQLYFIFDNEGYEAIMIRLEKIIKHMKVDNNTDMFLNLVEDYEKNNITKKKN